MEITRIIDRFFTSIRKEEQLRIGRAFILKDFTIDGSGAKGLMEIINGESNVYREQDINAITNMTINARKTALRKDDTKTAQACTLAGRQAILSRPDYKI